MSDVIYRQAAIDAVRNFEDCENGYSNTYDKSFIISALEELPSAQPQTGRWINVDTVIKELGAECFAKRINGELIALGGIEGYAELRGMEVEHE